MSFRDEFPPVPPTPAGPTFGPLQRELLPGAPPGMPGAPPGQDPGFGFPPVPIPAGGSPSFPSPDQGFGNDEEEEPQLELYPGAVDYNIDLDETERTELGLHIIDEIRKYYQDTERRFDNCRDWRADFELIKADGEGPWPDSAAVRAPLTENAARNHHTRLNQQIIHSVPPFVVEALTEEAIEAAPQIQEALVAQLEEADWKTVANEVHSELPVVGNCFLRVTFEHDVRRQPRHQLEFDEELYVSLLQSGYPPVEAMQEAVVKDKAGKVKMSLVWQNVLVSSGVKFRVVPFEDGIIFPANIRDPADARGIGMKLVLRGADLKQGAKRGQYLQEAVDDLLEWGSEGTDEERQVKLDFSAISPDAGPAASATTNPLHREYRCWELCYLMDVNGDDELEWAVITVHESGKILRCQHLPYHHGQPFFVMFRYFTRARELFGMGVAEKIATIQDAATTVLNQLVDHADLSLNVFGNLIYEKQSGFKPEKFEWRMGRPIPCDNIDGIKELKTPQLLPEHYQLYKLFKDIADLTTASANPSLGQTTDGQKTLGEVQIVMGASNAIFEEVAQGVSRDWAQVWDHARWLLGQYGDGGQVKFRKTALPSVTIQGEDGMEVPAAQMWGQMTPAPGGAVFDSIPSHILLEAVDLVPAGLKQLADMQSRVQQASLVQSTLLQHPLVGQSIDAQVVMLDEYLQALRYPQAKKMMQIIDQVAAQVKQQQMLMQMMQTAMPGGMPGMPAPGGLAPGGGGPGQPPEAQGPQGAPSGFPEGGPATGPQGVPMPPQPGGQRT